MIGALIRAANGTLRCRQRTETCPNGSARCDQSCLCCRGECACPRPDAVRALYRQSLSHALLNARNALDVAQFYGYRADCLRCAVADLRGALKNVDAEDAAERSREAW